MPELTQNSSSANWRMAPVRRQLLVGISLFLGLLVCWGPFCQYIQERKGIVLDDWLLDWLPAHDVSGLIFVILWSTGGLLIYRVSRDALLCNRFIWAYILIFASRLITITLVPLNPPKGLLELIDPLSNLFYGVGAPCITKDLFYSGHTSILVLIALCLEKPSDRKWAFVGATAVGGLLLIQHVHYTVDVLAAPLFSYAAYRISRRATRTPFSLISPLRLRVSKQPELPPLGQVLVEQPQGIDDVHSRVEMADEPVEESR